MRALGMGAEVCVQSLEQGPLLTQRNMAPPLSTPFCSPVLQLGK